MARNGTNSPVLEEKSGKFGQASILIQGWENDQKKRLSFDIKHMRVFVAFSTKNKLF